MGKWSRIPSRIARSFILKTGYVNTPLYMKLYLKWLSKHGMRFSGKPSWISNDVYFDGSDYSLISIGEGCTISREVLILTHDFAVHTVMQGDINNSLRIDIKEKLEAQDIINKNQDLRGVSIGNNSFIGVRAVLLPGTQIGNNCIVGAGAVVKGVFPDNTILIGNPAKIIAQTDDWLLKKAEKIAINKGEKNND